MSLSQGLYGEKKDVLHLQADATSLADLKAETVRKKAEAVANKQRGNYRPEKNNDKKTNIWSKENTGLLARIQRDMENSAEEERTWQKSKSIMTRKSKLYDSLKRGKGRSEVASNFLVQFDRRSDSESDSDDGQCRATDYPAKEGGEEWVEYTDSLGRTRTCMRKDLRRYEKQKLDRKKSESSSEEDVPESRDQAGEPDMLSEDMRREMLRQKWEKEELENLAKDSLHYSDVRFDEARAHGAGFYAFSKDDDTRSKEQDTLKKLHEETDQARKERMKKGEKRKREMADRIRKIKQKRREKVGLPPLEEDQPDDSGKKSESEVEADFTQSVVDSLKQFRQSHEEEEKRKNEIRRRENLRDWDVGKEGLDNMKKEWKVLTQQEWMEKQRKERKQEFAPPTAFNEARNILQKKENEFIKSQEQKRRLAKLTTKGNPFLANINKIDRKKNCQGGVSSTIVSASFRADQRGSEQNTQLTSSSCDPVHDLLEPDSRQQEPFAGPLPYSDKKLLPASDRFNPMSMLDAEAVAISSPKPAMKSYSTAMRLEMHRKMLDQEYLPPPGLNARIINELDNGDQSEQEDERKAEANEEAANRGRRAEVAPPCVMDYYASTNSYQRRTEKGFKSREDMTHAFNQGLNVLRK